MNDLERAIAIIEESRQTHVNWAEWRRKGNGTDTDHEMIGDLEWHENAIRDYDHVLSVLRAAPRAEGLPSVEALALAMAACGISDGDGDPMPDVAAAILTRLGAAPRAEGRPSEAEDWYELDRRILASEQRIVLLEAVIREAVAHIEGFMANGPQQPAGGWYGAQSWLAELPSRLRPSDERVPESEEPRSAPQEGRAE